MPASQSTKLLRSLCQEEGDPDLRGNFSHFLEARINLDPVDARLLELIKDFAQKYDGQLPSLDTLAQLAQARYNVKSEELKRARSLGSFSPTKGVNFQHELETVKEDQTLDSIRGILGKANSRVGELRGKKGFDSFRIVQSVTGDIASGLFRLSEQCRRTDQRSSGEITDREAAQEYIEAKKKMVELPGGQLGIFSGYEPIDDATKGFKKGDLVLVAGYTGELKSTMCRNMMYNMMKAGYNCIYYPCEQGYIANYDLLVAMHSTHQKWNGREPLPTQAVETGRLTQDEFDFLQDVTNDFWKGQQEGIYGRFIIEPPNLGRPMRWSDIVLMTQSYDSRIPGGVDVICVDYYEWVDWDGPAPDHLSTPINEMIRASKQFAMSFRDGRGLLFLAPFQINNEGYKYAQKHDGEYDVSHLSTHNQSRRAADVVISTYLGPTGSQYRQANQAKVSCLKMRGSSPFSPLILQTSLSSGKILNSTLSLSPTAVDDGVQISPQAMSQKNLDNVLQGL